MVTRLIAGIIKTAGMMFTPFNPIAMIFALRAVINIARKTIYGTPVLVFE